MNVVNIIENNLSIGISFFWLVTSSSCLVRYCICTVNTLYSQAPLIFSSDLNKLYIKFIQINKIKKKITLKKNVSQINYQIKHIYSQTIIPHKTITIIHNPILSHTFFLTFVYKSIEASRIRMKKFIHFALIGHHQEYSE